MSQIIVFVQAKILDAFLCGNRRHNERKHFVVHEVLKKDRPSLTEILSKADRFPGSYVQY